MMFRRLTAWVVVGGVLALLAGSALAQGAKKADATVKLSEGEGPPALLTTSQGVLVFG
jgi:hypothetical protein